MGIAASTTWAEDWSEKPRRTPSNVQHGQFYSAALRGHVGYNIALPPEYNAKTGQRFPVIYYLHGYKGHESSFLEYVDYWRQAVSRFGPVILVFANGGETTFFTDAPDGSAPGETVVVKELIPHIDQKFRTVASREGRSLHGYSMGGFGALKIAFKHPELFRSVVAYGATLSDATDFRKHLDKVFARQFGNDPQRYAANDPVLLAEQHAGQLRDQPAIRIVIGTRDEFLPRHRVLNEKLKQLNIPHQYEEVRGAKHKKEDLYEPSALRGFEFSMKHFQKR